MNKRKIFCVGLHKTGTTSLKRALTDEGYRVATYFGVENPNIEAEALAKAFEFAKQYDAFQDDPWYILFRQLDEEYPGSKFILTTRDSKQWFQSCLKHFSSRKNFVREWFYGAGQGAPLGNKKHWISCKEKHEADVRSYFMERNDDFLEMDITRGDGWELLGPFLGLNEAPKEFPRANTATSRTHELQFRKYERSAGFMRFIYRLQMKLNRELNK